MALDHQEQGQGACQDFMGRNGVSLPPTLEATPFSTPIPSHPIPPVAVSEGLAEIGKVGGPVPKITTEWRLLGKA